MKFQRVSKESVDADHDGMRLDNFLISLLKGVPRSKIYSIIRRGEVRVNSLRYKPKQRISLGDIVRIPPIIKKEDHQILPSENLIELIKRQVIYEDSNLLALNKPIGIASHGGSGISLGLIEIVRQIKPAYKAIQLVHRLDKDTSGCILLAKKKSKLRELHLLLRQKKVSKDYVAITKAGWKKNVTEVTVDLDKVGSMSGEQKVKVVTEGKFSTSLFKVLKQDNNLALVNCSIKTGRTHQIRVHCDFLGHPIVGDRKYGNKIFNKEMAIQGHKRMMLHAKSISFPSLDIGFQAEEPKEFINLANKIK